MSEKLATFINCLCWSPDGNSVTIGCQDGTIKIWTQLQSQTPKKGEDVKIGIKRSWIENLVWFKAPNSDSHSQLLACSEAKKLHIFSVNSSSFSLLHTIEKHNTVIQSLHWNQHLNQLQSFSNKEVHYWDIGDIKQPKLSLKSETIFQSFANLHHNDQNLVCIGCRDGQSIVWNLRRPKTPYSFTSDASNEPILAIATGEYSFHMISSLIFK